MVRASDELVQGGLLSLVIDEGRSRCVEAGCPSDAHEGTATTREAGDGNLDRVRDDAELQARIKVVGVGGGGGNAVNTMIQSGLEGVEFIAANTDTQALDANLAPTKIQLGGAAHARASAPARNPESAARPRSRTCKRIEELLAGADMVFVTAGMGGGTGTGAAPVIAQIARDQGALTVGVVTKPFLFEGRRRMQAPSEGIEELARAGRHAHHDPEPEAARSRRRRHVDGRGVPQGRRGAAPGGAGHQRPDHPDRHRSTSTSPT